MDEPIRMDEQALQSFIGRIVLENLTLSQEVQRLRAELAEAKQTAKDSKP